MSTLSAKILSDITIFTKYAKFIPEKKRRETFKEIVDRNRDMHLKKFKDNKSLCDEITELYKNFVETKKILPSMRSMQFGGKPIELSPNRIYNCAYLPIDDVHAFSESMFLLLGGTGIGYSVQKHHIERLPEIKKPTKNRRYLIGDSIEGWADAVKALMQAYMTGRALPKFDFSDIREKGAPLITSGGKAPGPEPLKDCLHNIRKILDRKQEGSQLTTLEVHDIMCYIADAVLAGGIRRAALICLFDMDDEDMLTCKSGSWSELNPQRGRANNSAVILRHKVKKKDFIKLWERIKASGSGEPGFYFTNNADWGTNPSLRGGTKVLTTDGIYPIEELQDKEFYVKNLNGQISKAKCWLSGKEKQLYKIKLRGGHEYYATPEHEWPVWNGKDFIKIRSEHLEAGDQFPTIVESKLFDGKKGDREDGFFIGWHLADGWSTIREEGNLQNGLIVSKKDSEYGIDKKLQSYLKDRLNLNCNFSDRGSTLELNTSSKAWNSLMEEYRYSHKSNGLPKTVWTECSEDFRKGLIDALISADGHIEKKDKRIVFTSSHEKLAKDVSELLGFYGIKTSLIAATSTLNGKEFSRYDVKIGDGSSIRHFRNLFTLSVGYKNDQLKEYKFRNDKIENSLITVTSVELSEIKEDVWDISVLDETHCFQIAHCITGNCCEIALRPFQFCNLCEVNMGSIENQQDLNDRSKAAAFIGTLQASYTDFHYLRDIWKKTTERDALIGVSGTGIASGAYKGLDLELAAQAVIEENKRIADLIGINHAARATCNKPAGTSSMVLGTASGIHGWHGEQYLRRMRLGKNEAIYKYLYKNHSELVEDEFFKPNSQAIVSIPVEAPIGAIFRTESAIELLERVKLFHNTWIKPGHVKGDNTHNVSATISIKENEWEEVGNWMWINRDCYNGLSVLPFDGGTYIQAPFETITKQKYDSLVKNLIAIDLTKVKEIDDDTNLSGEAACSGGVCELAM